MAQFTKNAIIKTFLELLKNKSLDKITVKDIVDECGINRNTFYYYYKDIYDLIEDIFRQEKQKVLQNNYEYESFYEELKLGIKLILEYKPAIAHIYHSRSGESFEKYLETVSEDFVRRYVNRQAEGLGIRSENIQFVIECYSASLKGVTEKWIQNEEGTDPDIFVRKLSDVYENTIKAALLALNKRE